MSIEVKDANGSTLTIDTINDLLTALQSAGGRAFEQISDGTNSPAIKAASTAPAPTDPSLTVAFSPNSPLPTGTNAIGKVDPTTAANWGIGSSTQNSAIVANGHLVLGQFNTAPSAITSGNMSPLQLDANGNLLVNIKAGAGSGGTAIADSAAFTEGTTSFTPIGGVFKTSETALTSGQAGAVALSANRELYGIGKVWDGTNTAAVKAASTAAVATDPSLVTNESPNSQLSTTIGSTAGTAVVSDANGTLQQYLRGLVKLFAAAVAGVSGALFAKLADGSGNLITSTANAIDVNIKSGTVSASQAEQVVAKSSTNVAFSGGSGGAAGDWLDFIRVIPLTTSPGAVMLADGAFAAGASWTTASTAITMGASLPTNKKGAPAAGDTVYDNTNSQTIGVVSSISGTTLTLAAAAAHASSGSTDSLSFFKTEFLGGTSSIGSLVPWAIPVRANSQNGAWKITIGDNLGAVFVGNPT